MYTNLTKQTSLFSNLTTYVDDYMDDYNAANTLSSQDVFSLLPFFMNKVQHH